MARSSPSVGHADVVTGLFRTRESAERAYRSAVELGYEESDINLVMSDDTRNRYFSYDPRARSGSGADLARQAVQSGEEPAKGAELGGPIGGTMGTIAPVLAAVGTLLLIPGIVIAGPVAVALTAAGAVGVAGGLAAALTDWGIPNERVRQYEEEIRDGGILMGVDPRSDEDAQRLQGDWKTSGGELVR